MTERFRYRVHGIIVESVMEFPSWPCTSSTEGDVWTLNIDPGEREGTPIDRNKTRGTWTKDGDPKSPDRLQLKLQSIEDPSRTALIDVDVVHRTITATWAVHSDDSLEGAEYLLTVRVLPVIARLLHDSLPLHGTVVQRDGVAVIVCGNSGAGKSTLSGHLLGQPATVVSDEPAVVEVVGGVAFVSPGPFAVRLHDDSDAAAHLSTAGFRLIKSGDKVAAVAGEPRDGGEPLPVAAIIMLAPRNPAAESVAITTLSSVDASLALMRQRYCPRDPVNLPSDDFVLSAAVAAAVPVLRVVMPDSLRDLPAAAQHVWSHATTRAQRISS